MIKNKVTITQLEQYLSKAAWILKGPVDASDFKVYIFPLLFFKRISDVYDEEYRIALDESGGEEKIKTTVQIKRCQIFWWNQKADTRKSGQEVKQTP